MAGNFSDPSCTGDHFSGADHDLVCRGRSGCICCYASGSRYNLTKTNVENVIGKTAKVSRQIDNVNSMGEAVLEGETWTARSENNDIIAEGTLVTVVAVEGVKLIVRV